MYLYNDLFSILLSKLQKLHSVCVEMTFCTERRDVCIGLVIIYFSPSFFPPFNSLGSQLWEVSNMRKICLGGGHKKKH